MTHDELVQRAYRWVRGTMKSGVALAEYRCAAFIEPDVLGFSWSGIESTLVECKVSRSDFQADRKKWIHNPALTDQAPGLERWYFTPRGLIRPEEVPEGWGLAEVRGSRVFRVVAPKRWRELPEDSILRRRNAGLAFLYSFARRVTKGVPFNPETGRFEVTPAVQPAEVA